MNNLFDKIEDLGSVKFFGNEDSESSKNKNLSIVNSIMNKIPDNEITEFISKFGNIGLLKMFVQKTILS